MMTLEEMMTRFSVVKFSGRPRIMELDDDGKIVEFYDFQDFKNYFTKEVIAFQDAGGKPKTLKLAQAWLDHPDSKRYEGLSYHMPGSPLPLPKGHYNGWRGYTVEPSAQGSWDRNKAHIYDIICDSNETHFTWVMNWLAALFQRPGKHGWTSIVMRGGQGIGKGHFADFMIGQCFHTQQYLHVLGANQLTAEFNEHLSGKVLVFADESTWGGDPRAASKLKGLITEGMVPINRKFLPMVSEPSALHILIASNNEWPIPIERDDRRFLVLQPSEHKKQDQGYFNLLREEFQAGGREAMLHELLEWEINDHMLRQPPRSAVKDEIAIRSLKPVERWWFEILEQGVIDQGQWVTRMQKSAMHELYLRFLDVHYPSGLHLGPRQTETELGMFLAKFAMTVQNLTVNGTRQRMLNLPPLEQAREAWLKTFGWPSPDYAWDGEADAEHLPGTHDAPFDDRGL